MKDKALPIEVSGCLQGIDSKGLPKPLAEALMGQPYGGVLDWNMAQRIALLAQEAFYWELAEHGLLPSPNGGPPLPDPQPADFKAEPDKGKGVQAIPTGTEYNDALDKAVSETAEELGTADFKEIASVMEERGLLAGGRPAFRVSMALKRINGARPQPPKARMRDSRERKRRMREQPIGEGFIVGQGPDGAVKVDLSALIQTKAVLYANSGGGKSWFLRLIAERAGPKVQVVIIDPEGEFATLRKLFKLIIVGANGDIPADPGMAKPLASLLLRRNLSAVFDLSSMTREDKIEYVAELLEYFAEEALEGEWKPLLILMDEAHRFAVANHARDKSDPALESLTRCCQAVMRLCDAGRKRGFGMVFATQQIQKLHTTVRGECNNKFVGRAASDVDQSRATKMLGMKPAQSRLFGQLMPGEFFAEGPALSVQGVVDLQVGKVATHHPNIHERGKIEPPAAPPDMRKLIEELKEAIAQAGEVDAE